MNNVCKYKIGDTVYYKLFSLPRVVIILDLYSKLNDFERLQKSRVACHYQSEMEKDLYECNLNRRYFYAQILMGDEKRIVISYNLRPIPPKTSTCLL